MGGGKPKIICEKKWQKNEPNIESDNSQTGGLDDYNYRGFSPYATFGTWKKVALAKNRINKIFILYTQ